MSKHSIEQLREMALECQKARDSGDVRYQILIAMISMRTGLPIPTVASKIDEYAKEEK